MSQAVPRARVHFNTRGLSQPTFMLVRGLEKWDVDHICIAVTPAGLASSCVLAAVARAAEHQRRARRGAMSSEIVFVGEVTTRFSATQHVRG